MRAPENTPSLPDADARGVVVCGLGRLGQSCVAALKHFGVPIHGVDLRPRDDWETPHLTSLLASLSIGDCRSARVLEEAHIARSRAVLLVTRDERINIAAAFAVRSLRQDIRIVVRSGQKNLNQLLAAHLTNFVAYEPSELSAPAFALAALADKTGDGTAGVFHLEEHLVRVVGLTLSTEHPWCGRDLGELNASNRRIVGHRPGPGTSWRGFQDWESGSRLKPGDAVTYLELSGPSAPFLRTEAARAAEPRAEGGWNGFRGTFTWAALKAQASRLWFGGSRMRRVVMASALAISSLYSLGSFLYWAHYPEVGWQDALNVGMVLILGGYDNLFGQLRLPFPIPPWLHVFSVLMSVSGTVGIGILYAFLTERVLSVRFQFRRHRPPFPRGDHVVLIGMSPIGEQIAAFLRKLGQPIIVLAETFPANEAALSVPYVVGTLKDSIEKVRLRSARSIVALSDDEVVNLEAALVARAANPRCTVIIRSDDAAFRENIAKLVQGARPLGVYSLAAEAFATAALGEGIHSLLHIGDRIGIVTEYQIAAGDSMRGRLVGQVGPGFGVIPVLLQRAGKSPDWFPSDDVRLEEHDRLIVLATKEALRDIENGTIRAPSCRVRVDSAVSAEAAFEGAVTMVRISGCDLATAQQVFRALPAALAIPLYELQAERLVRELAKLRVVARWHREPEATVTASPRPASGLERHW